MAKKKKIENKLSTFTSVILGIFADEPFRPKNYKQVCKIMGIRDLAGKDVVYNILIDLKDKGLLKEERPYSYVMSAEGMAQFGPKTKYVEGTVEMKSTGKAYVIRDDEEGDDIFIAANNTFKALHGDRVRVAMFPKRNNAKPEGEIVEVLERRHTDFVGILNISRGYVYVRPDVDWMPVDIFIPRGGLHRAKDGDKVIAHLVDWPDGSGNPFGEITRVLGKPGENDVEMESILAAHEYPIEFPKEVEKEASKIPAKISKDEIKKRRDFRKIFTITIDPADAKDFDDAISLQKLPNGHWEVGVHIADVSHYVRPGSAIDQEALDRGTSVYLVDRTIPMLPEKLCNNVCSLRPDEEKLTFSAVFEMDDNAKIYDRWIGKTVIKSCRRYTYEEVQAMIDGGEGDYKTEILKFNDLATKLREQRMALGSINFHTEEVKFVLDENKKPIDTYVRVQNESHELIEDFMLLANRTVAETFGKPDSKWRNHTFVYRIHDEPNPEKLNKFVTLISRLGYSMNLSNRSSLVKSYNKLFKDVEGKGEKNLIETVAVRTMAKAVYSTDNIGHYGLAFDYYTHFTSPIRRYPDTMVHRLLTRYQQGGRSANRDKYEELCEHSSDMEQIAANAERESIKYKMVEFMGDKIGESFDAHISGITSYGIYCEIDENHCEGMVMMHDLDNDYYDFDEKNYCLVGRRRHRRYQLGDPIRITVARANLERRQLDFILDKNQNNK